MPRGALVFVTLLISFAIQIWNILTDTGILLNSRHIDTVYNSCPTAKNFEVSFVVDVLRDGSPECAAVCVRNNCIHFLPKNMAAVLLVGRLGVCLDGCLVGRLRYRFVSPLPVTATIAVILPSPLPLVLPLPLPLPSTTFYGYRRRYSALHRHRPSDSKLLLHRPFTPLPLTVTGGVIFTFTFTPLQSPVNVIVTPLLLQLSLRFSFSGVLSIGVMPPPRCPKKIGI